MAPRAAEPPPLTASGVTPAPSAAGFRWKWALLTIPITVGTAVGLTVVTVMMMAALGWSDDSASEGSKEAVGAFIVLGTMLLSGVVVGWLSPGRTLLEPAVGLVAATVALNLFFGDAETNPIGGWMLPFALGAAGAWLGEWLQGRLARR